MKIIVNGEAMTVQCENLAQLLCQLDYTADSVATAIDGTFVARQRREQTPLQAGMTVEVVAPMQGG